jgi:hypothetical protein
MKVRQVCTDENGFEMDEYRSCSPPPPPKIDKNDNDEFGKVVLFQVMMAIIGALSFWGVQIRRKANMTLFEYRKMRFSDTMHSCFDYC